MAAHADAESPAEEKAEGKAGEAAEEESESERRKRIQKEALAKLQRSKFAPTEAAGTTVNPEKFDTRDAQGNPTGTRATYVPPAKKEPSTPGFTASQVKPKEATTTGMPTQGDWKDRFPDASSYIDSVRMWRDEEREKAGPQKAAIKAAGSR